MDKRDTKKYRPSKNTEIKEKSNKIKKQRNDSRMSGDKVCTVKRCFLYFVMSLAVAILASFVISSAANDVFALVKEEREYKIHLEEEINSDRIADILGDAGVIRHPVLMKIYAALKNSDNRYKFKAGEYIVYSNMGYDALLEALGGKSNVDVIRITVPEGYTTDEIIDLFISRGIGSREGFERAINEYDYEISFVEDLPEGRFYRLEGYLYPDTYEFYTGRSESYYINKMLKRFEEVYSRELEERAKQVNMSIDEIVTLASMIQKETKYQGEFEYVSSVFANRLRESAGYPYLNCDSTVLYAIEHERGIEISKLSKEDLEYDSPYNTHKNKGLPPGAISNPGYEALICALYPAQTDYYYFVTDSNGHAIFAKTYEEHLKNVNGLAS